MSSIDTAPEKTLFGHPKGLSSLFGTEMWERFSYYGMRALLVLYMVDFLLRPERIDSAFGLTELKAILERLSGPLDVQPLASQIYGLYTSLVYLTPILGGFIADAGLRVLLLDLLNFLHDRVVVFLNKIGSDRFADSLCHDGHFD